MCPWRASVTPQNYCLVTCKMETISSFSWGKVKKRKGYNMVVSGAGVQLFPDVSPGEDLASGGGEGDASVPTSVSPARGPLSSPVHPFWEESWLNQQFWNFLTESSPLPPPHSWAYTPSCTQTSLRPPHHHPTPPSPQTRSQDGEKNLPILLRKGAQWKWLCFVVPTPEKTKPWLHEMPVLQR